LTRKTKGFHSPPRRKGLPLFLTLLKLSSFRPISLKRKNFSNHHELLEIDGVHKNVENAKFGSVKSFPTQILSFNNENGSIEPPFLTLVRNHFVTVHKDAISLKDIKPAAFILLLKKTLNFVSQYGPMKKKVG
jgi:hypothetical protein